MKEIPQKKSLKLIFLSSWMLLAPLIGSVTLAGLLLSFEAQIANFDLVTWILFCLLSILTIALALTPTTLIAIAMGYFLGWIALPIIIACYQIASLIGYQLAKVVDDGFIATWIADKPKVKLFLEKLHQNETESIILARISPILPFAIMNVVLALARVSLQRFFWAGLVGMLPRTLLSIITGIGLSSLQAYIATGQSPAYQQYILLALLLVSILGFIKIFRSKTTA